MTERWWAPQRATVDPDRVVMALFEPGVGDVATAVLGAHRAGAAAIETVAKGGLPSDVRLVAVMADARERFAPAMVDALAPLVGDSYAGLLARDLLDDAERGVYDLYRTCISKGVAPPTAASRAGAIYGVPMRQLGRYAAMAADAKANAVDLADAADRVLLEYAGEVADSEAEIVSKVTASERPKTFKPVMEAEDEPWRTQLRDANGEWTKQGPETKPAEAEPQAKPEEKPMLGRPKLQRSAGLQHNRLTTRGASSTSDPSGRPAPRAQRQMRAVATSAPSQQTQRPELVRPKLVRTGLQRAKLVRPELDDAALERLGRGTIDEKRRLEENETPPMHGNAADLQHADLLSKPHPEDTRDYVQLSQEMVFTVDSSISAMLRKHAVGHGTARSPRMFRMGYLTHVAGPAEFVDSPDADNALETHAKLTRKSLGEPDHDYITSDFWMGDPDRVERVKRQWANDDPMGDFNIVPTNDYITGHKTWVHINGETANRQTHTVDEFVLEDGAMGEIDGGYRHPQITLDPNQAYEISQKPQRFYNSDKKVFVNRWLLKPVEEDVALEHAEKMRDDYGFGKAVADKPETVQVRFWDVEPRDEDGQWTAQGEAPTKNTLVPTYKTPKLQPSQRLVRTGGLRSNDGTSVRPVRQQRKMAATLPPLTAHTITRPGLVRPKLVAPSLQRPALTYQQRAALAEGLKTPPAERPRDLPTLDSQQNYHLFEGRTFERLFAANSADQVIPIGPDQLRHLVSAQHMFTGEGVVQELYNNVDNMVERSEGDIMDEDRTPLWTAQSDTDSDFVQMGMRIRQLQQERPDIAKMAIGFTYDGALMLYGSRKPIQDQVIVEYDSDVDMTQPLEMIPIGRYRSSEMLMRRHDTPGETLVSLGSLEDSSYNAPVRVVRVANVRRYRVQND